VKRVCLVSSGTGGHLMPAVALARALQGRGHRTSLLTEGRAVEDALLDRCTVDGDGIEAANLQIGGPPLTLPWRLAQATLQARRYFREHQVDLLVGAGGRTTVPAALAARSLGMPVFLLEQNVVTGRANRLLRRLAARIYYGLPPRRPSASGLLTGTPLRPSVGRVDRGQARRSLGFEQGGTVILVTGGSQGARVLNEVLPDALGRLRRSLGVVHLSGADQDAQVRTRYSAHDRITALVRPMMVDMASLYAAADLVICRGGGGTVAELMVAGRAAVIVPYPHHRDRQQWHNGRVLEAVGAARLRAEAGLDVASLADLIGELLAEPLRLEQMGRAAAALAPADPCAQILADMKQLGALD
jgi:UDP-N-acetylglucosamine--N-acetylmuramyl-(pentapeptide) pyrophosphoryl-undecaprenol N-acetylglucosamine transferase